jgi:FlaA1/EpsC-like NDP-sugar epimerase
MQSYLITGGSGSFGQAFTSYLLDNNISDRICIYSRSEHVQADMAEAFRQDERLRFFIGDVRDRDRLRRAMHGVDVVIHAAALKRIEVGKYNPIEMVRTNIDGAINVIEAAQDAGVRRVVALSTDKAYQPISPYGQSKALAESLFLAANDTVSALGPEFVVTRYGNVWWSKGSVGPRWWAMKQRGASSVPVTDIRCTRFFMTMHEACELVHDAITAPAGTVLIPELPAYDMHTLCEAFDAEPRVLGLPTWEKLHESMSDRLCSATARRMTIDELRLAIEEATT